MENNSKKTLRDVSQEIKVKINRILKRLVDDGIISSEEAQELKRNSTETMSKETYQYCIEKIKKEKKNYNQRTVAIDENRIMQLIERQGERQTNSIKKETAGNFDYLRKEINSALEKEHNQLTKWISGETDKLQQEIQTIQGEQKNLSKTTNELKAKVDSLNTKVLRVTVVNNDNKKNLGTQHRSFPTLLKILEQKLNVYICGPAGSGKTTAAQNCAEALNVPFYFTGAIASEYKLTGFIDAQGKIVSTDFRKAYENGGLFLFDEIDASFPQAVLAFNAALANDFMDFPDKRVQKHENFYCIAAANTIGMGADRQYVGRNQLDAASLDRFVFLDWQYDENLEQELAENKTWTYKVQKIRKIVNEKKIRFVVSPRASIKGAQLLAAGFNESEVEEMVLWKGMDEATKNSIKNSL